MAEQTDKLILDVIDYRGNRVIFTEKKWKEKSILHPDLKSPKFIENLKNTIRCPNEVWQDYADPKNKACYYKNYSPISYVKAVVWCKSNPCHIVSAFQTNKIKEEKYAPKLKRIK
jgi:hypothetical protein